MTISIAIADDSALIRAGVEALLEGEAGMAVVGRASTSDDLLHIVDDLCPDVVVTDIRMPPTHTDEGIVVADRLREAHPDIAVVVLSQFADPMWLERLLRGGSARRGYLLKDHLAEPGELVSAIELVAAGGSFVDPTVVGLLLDRQRARSASGLDRLTIREVEILGAVATGKSNAAIGEALFIGHRAVEKHINSIFSKLDLHDDPDTNRRVQAALLYLQTQG
jgi:DNA-binding NarL/FixJ family response regulator